MATPNTETRVLDRNTGTDRPWLREAAAEMGHDLSQGPLRVAGMVIDEELAVALDYLAEHGPVRGNPFK